MSGDAELDAMFAVKGVLEGLEPEVQERVVWWAIKRFELSIKSGSSKGSKAERFGEDDDEDGSEVLGGIEGHSGGDGMQFEFFAELYDAAGPASVADKLLVAGYWQQKVVGATTFQALSLNKELKDLGHGVGHISRVLNSCIAEKPALVLQLKKSGSSRQAKKTYKLTAEGIKKVEAMIVGRGLPT